MIVEPDFVHHWKTELLREILDDETAEAYVIRFWSHCDARGQSIFPKLTPAILATIVRWDREPKLIWEAFTRCEFLEETEDGWRAHDWAIVNRHIISARKAERELERGAS